MDKYKLGNRICQLREKEGITQRALAYMLGVTDKAVSKWENGQSVPRFDKLEKMAQIFNVPVESLLGEVTESFDIDKERSRLTALIKKEKSRKILSAFISYCFIAVTLPFLLSLVFKLLSYLFNSVTIFSKVENILIYVTSYSLLLLTVIIFSKTVWDIYTQVKNDIFVRNSEIIPCGNDAMTTLMAIHHLSAVVAVGPILSLIINDYGYARTVLYCIASLCFSIINFLTDKYSNASVFLTDKGFFNESIESGEFVLYEDVENLDIVRKSKILNVRFTVNGKKYDLANFKTNDLDKVCNYFKRE